MINQEQIGVLEKLCQLGKSNSVRIYLVGGLVRDVFLGHDLKDKDLDFVVQGDAISFCQLAQRLFGGEVKTFPQFLTAKLIGLDGLETVSELDFATVRTEIYRQPGALPEVSRATSLEEDLLRRDFSINAMAIELGDFIEWIPSAGKLEILASKTVDVFDGLNHLKQGLVHVLHNRSFFDDPTRIYRACRYVARIGGKLSGATEEQMSQALKAGALRSISVFRKLTEIRKILEETRPELAFDQLGNFSILGYSEIIPVAKAPELLISLRNLAKAKDTLPFSQVWANALKLFLAFGAAEEAAFSLSRKKITDIRYELDQARNLALPVDQLSSEVLLLRQLLGVGS